ncbi:MAG TPA: endonuclease/exonuclease/phosphatase family protein [Polyangia bacterium]
MTFNVRYGTAADGENAWAKRRGLAVRVIRDFGPVVLGLQEALRFQLDEIRRELPVYGEVGVGRDDGARAGEYAAILYDRSRLELLGDGHFWLSDSPELPGSMTWGNRYPRIVTWARFRDRATGATFLAANTHWDHESQEAREKGARLMRLRLLDSPEGSEPLLVMGDLNCAADNPAFRLLLERDPEADPGERVWLADTFAALFPRGVGGSGTFHAFSGSRDGAKIDFVLVWPLRGNNLAPPPAGVRKEWRVLNADIVHTSEGGRYPSDHFPVTAVVMLADVAR